MIDTIVVRRKAKERGALPGGCMPFLNPIREERRMVAERIKFSSVDRGRRIRTPYSKCGDVT